MKKIIIVMFVIPLLSAQNHKIFGQEATEVVKEEAPDEFSLTGSVDTYFHNTLGTIEKAPNTSFSNLPGFSLGMVNLVASYTGKKSGFVADLVYGPRGSDAVFNAPLYDNASGGGSTQIINQMYVYYQLSDKVRINLGQFNTFIGYEVISPTSNFHYSTSYLFSWGPFIHTGLRADVELGGGWSAKLALMDPTDFTEFNPVGTYTFGSQVGYTTNSGSIFLNATFGDQDGNLEDADPVGATSAGNTFQVDITGGWNLSEKYYLGLNTSYREIGAGKIKTVAGIENSNGDNYGFYGLALYQKFTVTDAFMIGLRAEHFSEFKSGVGAIGLYNANGKASVNEITVSANFTSGNFRFIPEVRMDIASEDTFTKKSGTSAMSSMPSFNLAAVYTIPSINHQFKD